MIHVSRIFFLIGTACAFWILSTHSHAGPPWDIDVSEDELKRIADGTLTLMAFTVLPDITTSSLSISGGSGEERRRIPQPFMWLHRWEDMIYGVQ